MDEIDRRILNYIQETFPLVPEPFQVIGREVGMSEEEALARVQRLKEKGIIRRIGAVFDARKMGFVSTLVAASVPEDRLQSFVSAVNAIPGVTHNYRRNHDYNVWFTIISPSAGDLEDRLRKLRGQTGITDIISLPAVKTFKINARFNFADSE